MVLKRGLTNPFLTCWNRPVYCLLASLWKNWACNKKKCKPTQIKRTIQRILYIYLWRQRNVHWALNDEDQRTNALTSSFSAPVFASSCRWPPRPPRPAGRSRERSHWSTAGRLLLAGPGAAAARTNPRTNSETESVQPG